MSTILVLDDQPTNRDLLVTMLGYRGHRMLQAENGLHALELVRAERPDLVIADVLMPVMDGYEFARQVRGEPEIAGTNIVFYTANYLEREAHALAARCGVGLVLVKPAEPQVIFDLVDRALGGTLPVPAPAAVDDEVSRQHTRLLTDKLAEKVSALEMGALRLTALVRLGQHLVGETDKSRLLATFCREAREIMGARIAVAGILAKTGGTIQDLSVTGGAESDVVISAPRQGILGEVLTSVNPVRLQGLDGAQAAVLPASHRVGLFLGAALRTGSNTLGWLYFVGKPGVDEFTEEDEHIVSLLSTQLALAYENAARLELIEKHAAELEQRVAERTEALTRSNADLAQFAYVASHDLQEPLRMVASYTELLAKRYRGRLDSAADEFIEFACDGARRMQDLIRDLLAYSRIESEPAAASAVALDIVVDRALANLRQACDETGAAVTRDALPIVRVIPGQFVQVFQNLIGNAVKFHGADAPQIRISAERQDAEWRISVADNGIGIAPEFCERIFTIFQRLHSRAEYPGTGIGLAICKRVVERHGGRLWVRAAEGAGATFHFTIPDLPVTRSS